MRINKRQFGGDLTYSRLQNKAKQDTYDILNPTEEPRTDDGFLIRQQRQWSSPVNQFDEMRLSGTLIPSQNLKDKQQMMEDNLNLSLDKQLNDWLANQDYINKEIDRVAREYNTPRRKVKKRQIKRPIVKKNTPQQKTISSNNHQNKPYQFQFDRYGRPYGNIDLTRKGYNFNLIGI